MEFIDDVLTVTDELTFGRDADLILDEANRFMHRRTGSLRFGTDRWWLTNLAREHPMVLFGADGLRSVLPAGTRTALTATQGVITFQAGPSPYALSYTTHAGRATVCGEVDTADGVRTAAFELQLTTEQVEVLSAFARPRFQSAPMPTYAEVARALGISTKAVDHLLSDLRTHLRSRGVTGIDSIDGLVAHLVGAGRLRTQTLMPTSL